MVETWFNNHIVLKKYYSSIEGETMFLMKLKYWQIENIIILLCTGGGSWSDVFEGVFKKEGNEKKVAIKVSKFPFRYMATKREAAYLNQLSHRNIIKLFGITQNAPIILLELMELGDLNSALKVVIHFLLLFPVSILI